MSNTLGLRGLSHANKLRSQNPNKERFHTAKTRNTFVHNTTRPSLNHPQKSNFKANTLPSTEEGPIGKTWRTASSLYSMPIILVNNSFPFTKPISQNKRQASTTLLLPHNFLLSFFLSFFLSLSLSLHWRKNESGKSNRRLSLCFRADMIAAKTLSSSSSSSSRNAQTNKLGLPRCCCCCCPMH